MLNKKAAVGKWADIVFSSLIIFVIFFFAFSFTTTQSKTEEKQIQKQISSIDYEHLLLQYAKSPIGEKTTADMISEAYIKDDFDQAEEKAESFFSKYKVSCYKLRFSLADKELDSTHDACYFTSILSKGITETTTPVRGIISVEKVANLTLPVENKPLENIKLELFIVK